MTQNNLNEEIEKELLTYSGTTFTAPSEALGWLHQAMLRIAEKTVEAVRVEERCTFVPDGEYHACVPPCEGTVQNCATMTLIGTTTTVLRQFNS